MPGFDPTRRELTDGSYAQAVTIVNASDISIGNVNIEGTYNTSLPTLTNGQQSTIQLDINGRALVNTGLTSATLVDKSTFTNGTTTEMPIGGVFQTSPDTITSGTSAAIAIDSNRNVMVNIQKPLGQTTMSASIPVTIASNQSALSVSSNQSIADKSAFTNGTTIVVPSAGLYQSSPDTLTTGTTGAVAIDQNRNLTVNILKPLGQTTMSASVPVTIASNQSTLPVNSNQTGTPTETAVSVGTSITSVLAANASRKLLVLVNDSANVIYVSLAGGTITVNQGVRLNANGGTVVLDRYVPTGAIKAISSVASSNLLVEEG